MIPQYKEFEYSFVGISRTHWFLNKDEEMYQNLFEIVEGNMHRMLTHVPEKGTAIQAGGAYGLWPYFLCQQFHRVHTYEPHPLNYHCLVRNTNELENIRRFPYALSDSRHTVDMYYAKKTLNSYGAHFTKEGTETLAVDLDSLGFGKVDFIQLDIEGNELRALKGAKNIIERNKPVIVLEDRYLPQLKELGVKPGDAVRWLEENYGYVVVDEFHADKVLICPTTKIQ